MENLLFSRIREVDQILNASDDVKKNSKLHEILRSLKQEIEVGFLLPRYL